MSDPSAIVNGNKRGPLRHIKDLAYEAEARVNPNTSIKTLLETAHGSLSNATTFHQFGRPDLAFIEFIIARVIGSKTIPSHKDSPSIPGSNSLHTLHRDLIAKLKNTRKQFDALEAAIKADNARSGVEPKEIPLSRRPLSIASQSNIRPTSSTQGHSRNESVASSRRESLAASHPSSPLSPQKPSVNPKPLRTQNGDALSERFSRLRASQEPTSSNASISSPTVSSMSRSSLLHSVDDGVSGISQRPPSSFSNYDSSGMRTSYTSYGSSNGATPRNLPKVPDPTYTPGPGSVPLRPTAISRSSYADTERPQSRASNDASVHGQLRTVYRSSQDEATESAQRTPRRRRRASTQGAVEFEISAHLLYDYVRRFNILLIDVRSREDYDEGHIMATCGMCIEPAALRANMSADQLEESLVLSPETEQAFFAKRDEFDLVLYYDDSTPDLSTLALHGRNTDSPLRFLFEALTDYNHDKPLKRPPILLKGGVTAWSDLVGPQSLQSSSTLPRTQPNGRPLARRPLVTGSDKLGIQRRKRRDYNPLDEEEEEKWRERARSESIILESQIQKQLPAEQSTDEQDFEERFPDLTEFSHRHAEEHPPQRAAPRIPNYPQAPTSQYKPSQLPPEAPPRPPPPSYGNGLPPPIPSRPPPAIQRPSYSGVSERIVSPNASSSVASQLAPYISPKLKRLPKTGLHNFGVTCYMNATIQCLSATIPLTAFFLDNQSARYIQRNNWKGSKGLMAQLYGNLLGNLWSPGDADTLRPTNLRKFCARMNQEWGIDRQQDAKEFLEFVIDCLHEDFNSHWERTPLRALTEKEEAYRESMPAVVASQKEWERYLHRDQSKITDLFAGQHISRLRCTTCGFTSTTYEAFYSISVEIPQRTTPVTIYDCLRSYCSEEKLSGDEVWRCPKCKVDREATKRIIITRVPEFLVVHFKRFSASQTERARKICTPVDFPLDNFDLEPFVHPLPPADKLRELEAQHPGLISPAVVPPFKYDAYGVMRHIGGTLTSGHYIALVKDRARSVWREFNDSRVTDFRPEDLAPAKRLQNEQAYIVFFQRG